MAEFKLGRIRFVWKGTWGADTVYYQDDVVAYGGKTYICVTGHTSQTDFFADFDIVPPKWNLVSEGQNWKGEWQPNTYYVYNDIVFYGARLYICNTIHTSAATAVDATDGLEADIDKWDTYADGLDWQGEWTTSTRYRVNDFVKYGGSTYVCNTLHVSTATAADGLENDISNWDVFNQGLEFKGDYASGVRYKYNDLVRYGAGVWICATPYTSAGDFGAEGSNWAKFVEGFQYENDWSPFRGYQPGDVVRYGGNQYYSTQTNINVLPTSDSVTWEIFTEAFRFIGDWNEDSANQHYKVGEVVRLGGYTYVCTQDHNTAQQPPNADYWKLVNEGFRWRGEWLDDQEYFEGDIVRYDDNSYICIKYHISEGDDYSTETLLGAGGGAEGSRPDLADSGQYWSIIAVGTEQSVLTTEGDLVYFSGSTPTRLPIGKQGQVLQVSTSNTPEWAFLQSVDNIYYVAEHGQDIAYPEAGSNIDRPFKSIRYACEQIEKGPKNPNAQYLLEMNRVFIQEEVTSWINYQIANAGGTGIWNGFTYAEDKCKRDVGFIVDRIKWDLGHGGNLKTRAATQTYLNALGDGPYSTDAENNGTGTYNNLDTEYEQDVASYNYMLEVIQAVLNNEAPTTVYQNVTDDSTAIVDQYINETIEAEPSSYNRLAELVGIVTTALASRDTADIPEREVPQTLIKVSTGKHYEYLPIRVPAYCAIIGDELRSTHVIAAGATTPASDTYYTIKTFDRVAEVVSDIVTGTAVTPTTGNTEPQSQEWPLAITDQADDVNKLVKVMKYNVDYGLNTMESAYVTDPITLSSSLENSIANIKANIDFLLAEVIAFLEDQYPDLKYGKTDTKRDARYVIDSLIYDLTYGGNSQAVMTGLAYFDGDDDTIPQLPDSIKTETIATLNYLKTSAQSVAGNSAVASPYQTTIAQTLTGNVGSITEIANNIEDIIDIIDNGPSAVGSTTTLVDPTVTNDVNSTTALINAYSDLNSAVSTIQDATIDYINTNYGNFKYNSTLCRRDSGFLVDAGYYDAAFASNFWAVQNGISYFRPQASVVTAQQLEQEIGSIQYIKEQAATSLASSATAVASAEASYDEIIDILNNGIANADNIVYTDTGVTNATRAREQLVNNRSVIITEGINWLSSNFPLLTYDQTLCERDIGYTVDALAYDAQYGGNLATKNVMRSLFDQRTGTSVAYPTADEKTAGEAFYTQLGVICGNIVRGTGGYSGQNTSAGDAGTTYDTLMDTLCGYVSTAIANDDNDLDGIIADSAPSVTWTAAGIQTAVASLASDKTDIVKGTLQYITNNYSSLVYDHAKCSRDVAKILKAVGYDFQLNSNWQTLKHAHSYRRKTASEVYTANQKTATRGAIEYALTLAKSNVNGDTLAQSRIDASAEIIDAIIYGATTEGSVCQTNNQNAYYAMLQLERNRDFIIEEVKNYVNYNFVDFDSYYTSATCERDVGLIVDAVSYDLITGSNFASSVAGAAYYRIQSANVTGKQLMQTLDLIKHIRRLAKDYVDSTNYVAVYNAFTNVYDILEGGLSVVPTYTFPDNGTTVAADSVTAGTFQTNRATIISDVSSWLATNQSAQWTALGAEGQATCQRDMGYIIDAATYDVIYGGNYQSVIAGDSYYSYGTLQIGTGAEKTATLAALGQLKAELVADAAAASQAAVGNNMDDIIDIVTNGAGTVTTTYPSETGEGATTQTSFNDLQSGKATIQSAGTTYITDTFSSYTYDETLCLRDVGYYIDALKYDLMHPGNYASHYVARFYNNAVTGSQEEDMFYMRDATGLRNCTLNGLSGDLTPPNTYGYSEMTAGAYTSLDPGFGPDDFRTWIITRSPYMQGVTVFGTCATGQKVDGALHNGGNDSFVSNDFTQIISDGVGAHILNNGRAELVSVFTYYSHIGYLAETGGRIRATNGNNSYGDYGSIAEGVDPDETPVIAVVDNRTQYSATISNTNGNASEILSVEYTHAGNDYTEATINVFGPGANEEVLVDEFRDGAFNYALVDQDADPDVPLGGSGYVIVSNVAQSGSSTGIFLSATDGNLSSAYPGMKIYIIGGAGVGNYGIIDTYNAGSKEATVIRESDGQAGWDHLVPGTAITAPNSSSTYQIEPRVQVSTPTNSDTSVTLPTSTTWYDVKWIDTSEQYTGVSTSTSGTGTGATFDVTRNSTKYYLDINNAGTGYSRLDTITIAGGDVGGDGVGNTHDITVTITTVNSVTGAIVDYDFSGYACNGTFLAVGAGTNGAVSLDGETWTAETLPALGGGNYASIASGLQDDGSSTFKPTAIIAIADGDTTVAYSSDADTWSTSSLPGAFNATGENSIAFGQVDASTARFVVIGDADTDIARSENGGSTWTLESGVLPATGFDELAYGGGNFVAINSGTTSAAYSADGITWTGVTAPATFAAVTDIVWGNGKFVALGGTNGIMYSLDNGVTWLENDLSLPLTATERKLAYGQGMFIITSDDTNEVQYSTDGIYWQAYTLSTTITGGYNATTFGNPDRVGKFVILPNATGTGANAAKINTPAKARAAVANEQIFEIRISEPGSGYTAAPTITITDPNNIEDVVLTTQIGSGALANPTFVNRGTGFTTVSAEVDAANSNGFAEFPQTGQFVAVRRLTERPVNGSNVEFDSLPGEFYKLVNTVSFLGTNDGSYTGFLQLSPNVDVEDALPDGDPVELRIRFSQVRLTGHDFLDIGTGGFEDTNYPGVPLNSPDQAKETSDFNGGRVFYTATDQDGNFRVGDLFTIEQSTGVATLNADAFNIAGLQELSLGEVTLGGNSATVNEFSTDPFFTADSDNIIPTQRAVKAYIEAQIGGGGASLNVNSVTAGDVFIGADTITTLSEGTLNIKANVVFSGTVLGLPLAYNYFLR